MTVQIIKDTLDPIAKAYHVHADDSAPTTYITFFIYNEQPEAYAENKPTATGTYWQFDLWRKFDDESETDLDSLKKQITEALENLGFAGFTAQELYEKDTETDHIALRCNYVV